MTFRLRRFLVAGLLSFTLAGCFHSSKRAPSPDLPSASLSTVTVSATSLATDGSTITITVTVVNFTGTPLVEQAVQIGVSGSGNTLVPIAVDTDAAGVVTATLSSTTAEAKVITVTVNLGTLPVVLAQRPTVTFLVGPAARLLIVAQPVDAIVNSVIKSAVRVEVQDLNGNVIPTATALVSLAIGTNPAGGTLSGTTELATANGEATFTDLSIDQVGSGYTLVATSPGLTSDTSQPFDIEPTPLFGGYLTYESVPPTLNGLDFANATPKPIRGAYVRLLDASSGAQIGQTVSADDGRYGFSAPGTALVKVRVLAWTDLPRIRVQDNTRGDAIYTLESGQIDPVAEPRVDLHAASGWGGTRYTGLRAAAPFAILDATYAAAQAFLAERAVSFPELRINWSEANRPEGPFLPAVGMIGTSFWDFQTQQLYLLGQEDVDTDEFDVHVIVHEWGHYFEDMVSRTDSRGGAHSDGDVLDPRVAWSEGWGNALSAVVLYPDSFYVDTAWMGNSQDGWGYELETNWSEGWFSENSVQGLVYDLFDPDADIPADVLSLGIGALYDVMAGPHKSTAALTTIFSFIKALKDANPADAAAIDALAAAHGMDLIQDEWATGETRDGGWAQNLPLYRLMTVNGSPLTVTLRATSDQDFNKLHANRYVRFLGTGVPVTITSSSAGDVDLYLYRAGQILDKAITISTDDETVNASTVSGETYVLVVEGWHTALGDYVCTVTISSP